MTTRGLAGETFIMQNFVLPQTHTQNPSAALYLYKLKRIEKLIA